MVMAPRLDQRQTQSLVMTPQLQQAIKLLQLSNLELTAFVAEELERNPLLEADTEHPENAPPTDAGDIGDGGDGGDGGDVDVGMDPAPALDDLDLGEPGSAELPAERDLDADFDGAFEDGSVHVGSAERITAPSAGGFDEDLPGLEETLAERLTLRQHLAAQLGYVVDDPPDRLIGAYLIDLLDDAGYLGEGFADAAVALGAETTDIERVLAKLQTFEPTGVFARSLAECLALQLKERDRYDPAMQAFVENLELVAGREFTKLARICGVDTDEIPDMLAELRALDPKPGLSFAASDPEAVVPDVLMVRHPKGGWMVELNTDTLPRVLVNTAYHARVMKQPMSKDDRRYLAEQFQSANWLVRALHQRATTILKVSAEIVRQQDAFFRLGVRHMRPLVLRDIADVIEMHESTVSRFTSQNYIETPRGVFELKYFFTAAIGSTTGGEQHSAEAVRFRIKELIDAESPIKVLSDDKIVQLLKKDGYDIARRTVAKYREALGLASSVDRRRQKAPPR